MKRRILMSLLSIVLLNTLVSLAAGTTTKPNIIIVITDDQGYGDLASRGNPIIKTPNLDKLHDEAIRFTNFHVSSASTEQSNK